MKYARLFELAKKSGNISHWPHYSSLISSGLNLSFPLIIGRLIDGIDQGGGQEIVNQYAIILLFVFAVVGVATFFRAYLFTVAWRAHCHTPSAKTFFHSSTGNRFF